MDQFISKDVLDALSYHSGLGQSLKQISLRKTPLPVILFLLYYHLILVIKYRKKILTDPVSDRAREIFEYIAPKYHITLEEWNHDRDHVHIMFRAHPKSELSKFINAYKSASSRLIKKEYPEIRQKLWKEMFWSQSFCLLSAGGAPIEVIRQYIETQGENKSEHRVPFSDLPE